ncbi:MAG: hypothetical protein KJO69_11075, partial [Gammaproteobacteria bacterium]|nr:hypothetical protein [Gammaproteobacteria bacterium]
MEGDVGTFHFHDNRALSMQHTYEILVDMIPRIYDTERVVRIKTPEDQEEMVTINQPVFDNESGKWCKVYDLSMGKYEVAVDVGASYTTQRQMASESMMELIQYAPDLAPRVLDLIAKNLDWPGADDIANRLKPPDPATQPPDPAVIKLQMEDKHKTADHQLKAQESEINARIKLDEME